jgi:predicted negative regulator of RcsB-dependent stress response
MPIQADITKALEKGHIAEALALLDQSIFEDKHNDELYYMRGNVYFKAGNWQEAMQNYMEAIAINPESPASEALKMANGILDFYNKDLYGQ